MENEKPIEAEASVPSAPELISPQRNMENDNLQLGKRKIDYVVDESELVSPKRKLEIVVGGKPTDSRVDSAAQHAVSILCSGRHH